MQFNSWIFLFAFLPLTLIGYFTLNKFTNKTYASYFLVLCNIMFYTYGGIKYTIYFVITILINYWVIQSLIKNKSKRLFYIGIYYNILSLAVLKYTNFFVDIFHRFIDNDFNFAIIFLPMGLSFFTFQFIALIYDCYKENIKEISFIKYLVYCTYFPKIIQGPITLYQNFSSSYDLENKTKFNIDTFGKGIYLFVCGLAKKILIADVLANFVNAGFGGGYLTYNATMSLLLMLAYTLQIYFDFSGYSDMACGISEMLHISLPQNFNSPYKALSINDFWKRWHMSLTNFFTRYVYFPLGGNRKGEYRTYLNVMIIFLLSGLWHGANYTFIVWGLLHGMISVLERKYKYAEKLPVCLRWVYTFVLVNVLWLFFRSSTITQAFIILKNILSLNFAGIDFGVLSTLILPEINLLFGFFNLNMILRYLPLLFLFGLLVFVLVFKNTNDEVSKGFKPTIFKLLWMSFLLMWCILSFGGKITFIYEMF